MKITNNMQLYRFIYYSKSALYVSGYVFAHHQEHLTVFTVSGLVHSGCCRLVSRMSWNYDDGRKHRPIHVELVWNNTLIYIVHLVGYFHSCITMHGFMNIRQLASFQTMYVMFWGHLQRQNALCGTCEILSVPRPRPASCTLQWMYFALR